MTKEYVIKQITRYEGKGGEQKEMVSYFGAFVNIVLPMLSMESDIKKAKKYSTKSAATIDLKKYFSSRDAKVIPLN